jgi:hypothetical protein
MTLIPAEQPPEKPASGDREQEKAKDGELRTFSKFDEISVAFAFALTGLIVVYLPETTNKSIDWVVEGRIIGVILAIVGAIFILMATATLTGREGFGSWGIALALGAGAAGVVLALHRYRVPELATIGLIVLIIVFVFFGTYALVIGFADFFEEPAVKTSALTTSDSGGESLAGIEAKTSKEIGWYERIILLIAVVSTIATMAAAVEPILH